VLLGGGVNHRYGLDDGVCITANHAGIAGSLGVAVKSARETIGHIHRIAVEVTSKSEAAEAIESGAGVLVVDGPGPAELADLVSHARGLSPGVAIEASGLITLENVRAYAEAGADLIRVDALTQSVKAMAIGFQIQPG